MSLDNGYTSDYYAAFNGSNVPLNGNYGAWYAGQAARRAQENMWKGLKGQPHVSNIHTHGVASVLEETLETKLWRSIHSLSIINNLLFFYLNDNKQLKETKALFKIIVPAQDNRHHEIATMGAASLKKTIIEMIKDGSLIEYISNADEKTQWNFYDWYGKYRKFEHTTYKKRIGI